MSIEENIKKLAEDAQADKTGGIATKLQGEAVEAIIGGFGSEAWKVYMRNFIGPNDGGQLDRLTAKEALDDPYLRRDLVYLVSDAVCGAETITQYAKRLVVLLKA